MNKRTFEQTLQITQKGIRKRWCNEGCVAGATTKHRYPVTIKSGCETIIKDMLEAATLLLARQARSAPVLELYEKVAAVPFWFHSIDLGNGVITPGIKSPEHHKKELASLRLPDLRGKSVIDIGAWDGFYSFTAVRLGAAQVVALDSHVWALDQAAKNRYKAECRKKGVPQQHPAYIPELWCFDKLPGSVALTSPV